MPRKPSGPKPGEWKYTVGEVPYQVTAYERADRANRIHTRVYVGNSRYVDKGRALTWTGTGGKQHDSIRDGAGNIIPAREIEAQSAALARQEALAAGRTPNAAPQGFDGTFRDGVRRLLHADHGKFPSETPHKADVRGALRIAQDLLPADLRWKDLRFADYRKVWRAMAREHKRSLEEDPGSRGRWGLRRAEVVCEQIAACARWLAQEGLVPPGTGEPARGWKAMMHAEWAEISKRPIPKRNRPRYTPEEEERLFAARHLADPRAALVMMLGAPLRLGQVARTRRSDVHPSPDGREPLWAVQVHGRGKKLGETPVLTDEERSALREALATGYLAGLESAFQRGEIADYCLFPQGRTRQPGPAKTARPKSGESWETARAEVLQQLGAVPVAFSAPELAARWGWHRWLVHRLLDDLVETGEAVKLPHGNRGRVMRRATKEERAASAAERPAVLIISDADKPLNDRTLADYWRELEDAAGVVHVEGRLWYGLRRRLTDAMDELAEERPDVVTERVKLKAGGWTKATTREGYQREGNMDDAVRTAEARALIRSRGARNAAERE